MGTQAVRPPAGLLGDIMEDQEKGQAHVDSLFSDPDIEKSIEEHDELAAVISHPPILVQMKMIVTGSWDKTVRVWAMETG